MDQFDNRENMNDNANGERPTQSYNPGYTPLSSFSPKKEGEETKQPQDAQPIPPSQPSYERPVYEQPAYSAPEHNAAAPTPEPQPQQSYSAPQGQENAPQQTSGGYVNNQNSGEYRYIPPYGYGRENVNGGAPHSQQQYRPVPPQPGVSVPPHGANSNKTANKGGRSFSTGAVALIVIACILLSFGSGMLGSMLVSGSDGSGSYNGEPIIINKNESNKNDADALPDSSDLVAVCAKVADSVVEITTAYNTTYGNYQYVNEGAGSGVIISENGYIITNNHVVTDTKTGDVADGVTVRLIDGSEYDAEVIGHDSDSDIAIIKINVEGLSAATVGDSDTLKVGEQVIAVGNPLGQLGGTITRGIVSATNREISVDNNRMTLVQIDAAINPGNSGGGLFNMNGELIGIVNAKSTGTDVEGLGFAIPVNEAIDVAGELRSNGYVSGRTYIGISLTDVTDSFTAYYYFRSENAGVYISQVQEGYNDKVLKRGDRITAIDGDEVSSSQDVKDAVKSHDVGDTMKFTLSRQGKLIEVEVTCYEYVPGEVSFKK